MGSNERKIMNSQIQNASGMHKPITVWLKKVKFICELPKDFVQLVSVENAYGHIPNDSFMEQGRIDCLGRYKTESFYIKDNKIYFSGSFNRRWFIRQVQRLIDFLFPKIYKVQYIACM